MEIARDHVHTLKTNSIEKPITSTTAEVLRSRHFKEIQAALSESPDNTAPLVVFDVDDVLLNAIAEHVRIMSMVLTSPHHRYDPSEIPTYDDVCRARGTDPAYEQYPFYRRANKNLRFARTFNKGLPILDESAPSVIEGLAESGVVHACYLTTRPNLITDVTRESLVARGYPDKVVIARPEETVPLSKTSDWKLSELQALQRATGRTVLMVDDSAHLGETIQMNGDPNIRAITFHGPVTDPAAVAPGVPLADWSTMHEAVAEVLEY